MSAQSAELFGARPYLTETPVATLGHYDMWKVLPLYGPEQVEGRRSAADTFIIFRPPQRSLISAQSSHTSNSARDLITRHVMNLGRM